MIRIGISGTNWTGKSSTLQAVLRLCPPDHVLVSLSQIVSKCPFPTGQDQTLEASEWVLQEVRKAEERLPVETSTVLYDRTSLDILAYTLYAGELRPGKDNGTIDQLVNAAVEHMQSFARIFYAPVDISWPHGPREAEEVRLATLMEGYLRRAAAIAGNVEELPAAIEARVERIRGFLDAGK